MPFDFFTPSWIGAYHEALKYKDRPVVFTGIDLGIDEGTAVVFVKLGASGWEIFDFKDPPPRAR